MHTKSCQNCKKEFTIENEDFSFYEKMNVPAPNFCSDCRMVRRMLWRNERSLYHRTCEATGKKVISCFSQESGIKVYDRDYWWSDEWDIMKFGKEYDFSKPFFEQFGSLVKSVPLPALFNGRCTNSSYSNHVGEMKNAYLCFASWICEDVQYCSKIGQSKECVDCLSAIHSDLCYECISINHCSRLFYSKNCENCLDSSFLYDCSGCSNCFGCANLRNRSYCIFNVQYSREEYFEKLKTMDISSLKNFTSIQKKTDEFWKNSLHKFALLKKTINSTGNNLVETNNIKQCFDVYDNVSDCKYCINGIGKMTDTFDAYGPGLGELMYEVVDSGDRAQYLMSTIVVWNCIRVSYSYNCHGSSDLFGCVGLRKKQYCIFNKQYTKEEYEALLPKVIAHMKEMPYVDTHGRSFTYGDFFPYDFSPFAYNETIAHEYFPKTQSEVLEQGFTWKQPEQKNHSFTIAPGDMPDTISSDDEGLLSAVIGCLNKGDTKTKCTLAYKITPEELSFYKRFNLPLPEFCPNCRFYNRMSKTNPPKLWHRQCMCEHANHGHKSVCSNTFETSYAPERTESVYCESCYNKEIV